MSRCPDCQCNDCICNLPAETHERVEALERRVEALEEQLEDRDFRVESLYRLIEDEKAFCKCGATVTMLIAKAVTRLPIFGICFACGYVGENGVGVIRPSPRDSGKE